MMLYEYVFPGLDMCHVPCHTYPAQHFIVDRDMSDLPKLAKACQSLTKLDKAHPSG